MLTETRRVAMLIVIPGTRRSTNLNDRQCLYPVSFENRYGNLTAPDTLLNKDPLIVGKSVLKGSFETLQILAKQNSES